MTKEEKVAEQSQPSQEQVDTVMKENQAYKTLLNMQNESYFRAEMVESLILIQNQLVNLNSTIDTRLEDLIKVLIDKKKA